MPRYLLAVDFQPGADPTPMDRWTPAEVDAHLAYYGRLNDELAARGELVGGEVLAGPDVARVVRSQGPGATTVTEGPFAEYSEWLAGFQVVEVASLERALEIAALVSAVPGRGGVPLGQPIQVREIVTVGPADAEQMREWLRDADGT
ncbi:YciI family protein [Cellulomonas gilvus]|uniref:YCII-related protein n=1 Tax=Cellulomonas gilvus (strain ATCC 13127 / NRRL B-14078) TaxID=593907 RepID=F8A7T5_CELGA|nr:YciI family protein [Cellulomonas gilvus]AEI13618.1 YCII-related protein [Cellulomonas gilvus ATCC 13127]